MGGKSRKTGQISKKLIDLLKKGNQDKEEKKKKPKEDNELLKDLD